MIKQVGVGLVNQVGVGLANLVVWLSRLESVWSSRLEGAWSSRLEKFRQIDLIKILIIAYKYLKCPFYNLCMHADVPPS